MFNILLHVTHCCPSVLIRFCRFHCFLRLKWDFVVMYSCISPSTQTWRSCSCCRIIPSFWPLSMEVVLVCWRLPWPSHGPPLFAAWHHASGSCCSLLRALQRTRQDAHRQHIVGQGVAQQNCSHIVFFSTTNRFHFARRHQLL